MRPNRYRNAIAHHFIAHPGVWVSCYTLMEIGGALAWRSRCSECRTQLGMTIERKETRDARGVKTTWRRYVPPSAPEQVFLRWEGGASGIR